MANRKVIVTESKLNEMILESALRIIQENEYDEFNVKSLLNMGKKAFGKGGAVRNFFNNTLLKKNKDGKNILQRAKDGIVNGFRRFKGGFGNVKNAYNQTSQAYTPYGGNSNFGGGMNQQIDPGLLQSANWFIQNGTTPQQYVQQAKQSGLA